MPAQEQPRMLKGLPQQKSFDRRIQNSIVASPDEFGENRIELAAMLTAADGLGKERTRFDALAAEIENMAPTNTAMTLFTFMSHAPRNPPRERTTPAPRISGQLLNQCRR